MKRRQRQWKACKESRAEQRGRQMRPPARWSHSAGCSRSGRLRAPALALAGGKNMALVGGGNGVGWRWLVVVRWMSLDGVGYQQQPDFRRARRHPHPRELRRRNG